MIIDSISVQNFMPFRDRVYIDLQSKSTVGIAGQNEAGKSSLLQAITYAGWGKTRADRDANLIHDNADGRMLVEVGFRLQDGSLLEISRGLNGRGETMLRATGFKGKVREAEEYISEKLRLPYNDFVALSYFVQGDIHGFMRGNKRDYFQRWTTGLSYWEALAVAADTWRSDLDLELDEVRRDIKKVDELVGAASEVKRGLRAASQAIQEALQETEAAQSRADHLRDALADCRTSQEAADVLEDLLDDIERAKGVLSNSERRSTNLLEEISNTDHGECPVLEGVHCKKLEQHGETHKRKLRQILGRVNREQKEAREHYDKLVQRSRGLIGKQVSAIDVSGVEADLAEAKVDLCDAHKKRDKANRVLGVMKAHAERIRAAKKRLPNLKKRAVVLERKLRRLQFLKYMCGKTGVPLRIVETELKHVEAKCNWVFERLCYGKRIRFDAYKELASFERVCPVCGAAEWRNKACADCGAARPRRRKDEPTVTILDGVNERVFELESGGAQVLESFAVRLACSLFRSSMTGVPMTLVLLDEVFAMLDSANRQKLMALVVEKLSTEFGLKQQLIVSHHDDVIHAVDDLLVVDRERGTPIVRWA